MENTVRGTDLLFFSTAALKLKKAAVLCRFRIRFANVQQKLAAPEVALGSHTDPPPRPSIPENIFFL